MLYVYTKIIFSERMYIHGEVLQKYAVGTDTNPCGPDSKAKSQYWTIGDSSIKFENCSFMLYLTKRIQSIITNTDILVGRMAVVWGGYSNFLFLKTLEIEMGTVQREWHAVQRRAKWKRNFSSSTYLDSGTEVVSRGNSWIQGQNL